MTAVLSELALLDRQPRNATVTATGLGLRGVERLPVTLGTS